MKKKTSTIFALALAAMLGMGMAEANAQRVVYKGTATINQKDGTSTKFDVSSLRNLYNTESYVRVITEEYGENKYFENVDNVSFDWVAKTIGEIKIDYKKEISGEELKQAVKDMRTQLGSALKAVYGMRGGKEGGPPQAHAYQFAYNLGPDSYVQYFCVPHYDFPYANFTLRSTYDLCKGCLDGPGVSFRAMKYDMVPTLNAEKIDYMPELKAIYLMLFNYSAIENVDLFGPMPYNDHKNYVEESPFVYDRVKDIYYPLIPQHYNLTLFISS
ncbi:SusD/RagB family nutrient-binding outer membrane lipoprotein [Leyella stercorea]|uniref:SusD/RagB family nutrient-binding outer membrane lipoprotein n=1 Tax=Leyella stercorea TaxID=363265 RepID=UPI00266BC2E1|nr:SusD/RagB family nutrient-binding outer membrane lipoprotein [Leyella stercorea]